MEENVRQVREEHKETGENVTGEETRPVYSVTGGTMDRFILISTLQQPF